MIRIKKSKNGQFYFVITAANGQVIVTSETYTTKEKVKKGINVLDSLYFSHHHGTELKIIDETKR